jgi:hypothetical protein
MIEDLLNKETGTERVDEKSKGPSFSERWAGKVKLREGDEPRRKYLIAKYVKPGRDPSDESTL